MSIYVPNEQADRQIRIGGAAIREAEHGAKGKRRVAKEHVYLSLLGWSQDRSSWSVKGRQHHGAYNLLRRAWVWVAVTGILMLRG